MTVNEYSERFFGLPVVEYREDDEVERRDCVYRLMQEYEAEQSHRELIEQFLDEYGGDQLEALVIGPWAGAGEGTPPDQFLQVLCERRLPRLRALFVGDMTYEDSEISWINQTNYTDLLAAYPNLEVLRIRGTAALELPAKISLPRLTELGIESGGLPSEIVERIAAAQLPALKKLELWLGAEYYGFDGNLAVYKDLLVKIEPQRLDYLGLRNSEISDELAAYVAQQPWLGKLHTLDLSMGTLGDKGAQALLASPHLRGLKVLDVQHHYISAAVAAKLHELPLEVKIGKAEDDDDERYVQVGE